MSNKNVRIGGVVILTFMAVYEFITFTPTHLTGLSGAGQAGQPITFQIIGDLTIRASIFIT